MRSVEDEACWVECGVNPLRRFGAGNSIDRSACQWRELYVRWNLGAPVATLEWDLKVLADPTSSVGIYLALAQGSIDGSAFYLGLQTDMSDPERVRGAGKGLIFSTWWTFDAGATRLAPGGFRELGTHEGRFVGVRRPYPWVVGDYRVTLVRSEPAGQSARSRRLVRPLHPADGSSRHSARVAPSRLAIGPGSGAWPFPGDMRSTPAMIEEASTAFMEVYSRARRWSDIPPWDVDLMAYGDGQPCPRGVIEYPVFPFGNNRPMPNTNARYDSASGLVQLRYGGSTSRADPAGRWP